MIKGIIWDVDGVILDSERIHAETESATAKVFGISITPGEVIRLYSGVYINEEFEDMAKRANKPMSVDKALEVRKEILENKLKHKIPLIPHIKEVILLLKDKYSQSFATSSEKYFTEPALRKVGLLNMFKACVYVRDIKKPKPDPEMFLKAAALLGINPQEVVVVEDSESGFKAAKAAGMLLIARKAEHNREKDFSLADYVVEDLREISKILENVNIIKT